MNGEWYKAKTHFKNQMTLRSKLTEIESIVIKHDCVMLCGTNNIQPHNLEMTEEVPGNISLPLKASALLLLCSSKKKKVALGCLCLERKGIVHCTTEILGQHTSIRHPHSGRKSWNKTDADQGYQDDQKIGKLGSLKLSNAKRGLRLLIWLKMWEVNSAEKEQFKLNINSRRMTMSNVTENTTIWYFETSSNCFGRLKIPISFINWTRLILKRVHYTAARNNMNLF